MFEIPQIKPLDVQAMEKASRYLDSLVKPPKSLGKLEKIAIQMAGITGKVQTKTNKKIHYVLGADNGIFDQGVASAPQNFTNLLLTYYANGENCTINVLTKMNHIDLKVVDMGVIGPINSNNHISYKLMEGTRDFSLTIAMDQATTIKAIEIGIELANSAHKQGYNIIGTGEVGMGNTSSSSACVMAALNLDSETAVGRGAGLCDGAFNLKKQVLSKAVAFHAPYSGPIDILSKVGGLDIAGLVGLYLGAAHYQLPIVIDGFISATAALLAFQLNPACKDYMIPSHISKEPGYMKIMEVLELSPLLDLEMGLGEGTGCPLAMNIIDSALECICEMLSFDESILDEKAYKDKL